MPRPPRGVSASGSGPSVARRTTYTGPWLERTSAVAPGGRGSGGGGGAAAAERPSARYYAAGTRRRLNRARVPLPSTSTRLLYGTILRGRDAARAGRGGVREGTRIQVDGEHHLRLRSCCLPRAGGWKLEAASAGGRACLPLQQLNIQLRLRARAARPSPSPTKSRTQGSRRRRRWCLLDVCGAARRRTPRASKRRREVRGGEPRALTRVYTSRGGESERGRARARGVSIGARCGR